MQHTHKTLPIHIIIISMQQMNIYIPRKSISSAQDKSTSPTANNQKGIKQQQLGHGVQPFKYL